MDGEWGFGPLKAKCEVVPRAAWDWDGDSSVSNEMFGASGSTQSVLSTRMGLCRW